MVGLPMTVPMEENKIPHAVVLVLTIAMLQFKHIVKLYHLVADWTKTLLLAQHLRTTASRPLRRQIAVAVLEVRLPARVKGVGLPFELALTLRGDRRLYPQNLFPGRGIGKAPGFTRVMRKVALSDPAPRFLRVALLRPSVQSPPDECIKVAKGLATETMAVVVRPAPEYGIQGVAELGGSGALGFLAEGADLGFDGLQTGRTGSNLELGRFVWGPLVFAECLP
jgi:hypothetical protein